MRTLIFGPVPTDTSRAIQDILDLNSRYLRIGNHLNAILTKDDIDQGGHIVEKSTNFSAILALVTVFQHVEAYTDQQAADAIQNRVDWKYALHLPLTYSGFDPAWLCNFRKHTMGQPAGAALLQVVVDRLVEMDAFYFPPGYTLHANEILTSICKINRIVQLTEAMLLVLEALSTREGFRLPGVCLPELYERSAKTYHRLHQLKTLEDINQLAFSTGVDIAMLWNSLQECEENDLQQRSEMKNLWKIWRQQYDQTDCTPLCPSAIVWRPVNCLTCTMGTLTELPP
jgi:transposase